MNGKSMMSTAKGLGIGMAIGAVAGAVGCNYVREHKKGLKRNVGKALRDVSRLVDNVGNMF